MRRHWLLISSMREASETLKVAAKNVSPLVRMLWLHCSTAVCTASLVERPAFSSSRKRVVIRMA